MANLLYLVHRMPYPPDKGDKVRSYHLLRHLAEQHRVFLGTFADDPADLRHLDVLRQWCAGLHVVPMSPRLARLRSVAGLATGEPLSVRAWRDEGMRRWVRDTVEREGIAAGVVYSSAVAQYADELGSRPLVVDFVDVDSAKWSAYAEHHAWPLSWLYRREGRTLLAYERAVASVSRRSFFSTTQETALFLALAPEAAPVCEAMGNGVDTERFAPDPTLSPPFASGQRAIVFTGAMDYWPNVDAVGWFVREMLPALRRTRPDLHFWIVGRSPSPAVQSLADEHVHVTGTVPDVRPYLQHATVVVAPLRLARGIQNKVLEAMAMGQPVVAADGCVQVLQARPGHDIVPAADAESYVRELGALLDEPARARAMGAAARQHVLRHHAWTTQLSAIDRQLAGLDRPASAMGRQALGACA